MVCFPWFSSSRDGDTCSPKIGYTASFDKVQGMIFSLLERVASCVGQTGRNVKVDRAQRQASARRAIQGAKIFFGYYQVVSGFIRFQVPLPDILQSTIRYLQAIGKILSFDVFEYPGLGLSSINAVGPNAGHSHFDADRRGGSHDSACGRISISPAQRNEGLHRGRRLSRIT